MPSKSRAKYRYMKAAEKGDVHAPGLSKEEAKDFTKGMSKNRFARLRERVGRK